jgi:hypothetical protein
MDHTDLELPKEVYEWFAQSKVEQAETSGNPVLMIEAILVADEKKFALPRAALTFVVEGFRRWYDSQATISLDEAFAIKPQDGKRHPYRSLLLEDRNEMLFSKMAALKALGARTAQAAEMVARGLEEHEDWNQSKWTMAPRIELETLLRLYSKWPQRREMEELHRETVPKWTQQRRRKFLAQFPSDSMPYRIKQTLRD